MAEFDTSPLHHRFALTQVSGDIHTRRGMRDMLLVFAMPPATNSRLIPTLRREAAATGAPTAVALLEPTK